MSTKLFSRSFSTYDKWYDLQIPFCRGVLIGCVKSSCKHNEDDVMRIYGGQIFNNIVALGIGLTTNFTIIENELNDYYFYTIEGEDVIDTIDCNGVFEDEGKWWAKPLCLAIKEANEFVKHQLKSRIAHVRYDQFSSLIEEKNYIQKSIALLGDKTFEYMRFAFCIDPFFSAVERAAVFDNDGFTDYSIPSAEEIFKVFGKLLKRWDLDYFKVIGAKKKEGA